MHACMHVLRSLVARPMRGFYVFGGAGNVCVNINSLGASVVPIGFIGGDENGKIIGVTDYPLRDKDIKAQFFGHEKCSKNEVKKATILGCLKRGFFHVGTSFFIDFFGHIKTLQSSVRGGQNRPLRPPKGTPKDVP